MRWPSPVADEQVALGEISLAVLPLDRTFLYLCVHGALDGWFRFKSLVDIAAIWHGFADEQRTALADQARECGILPEMAAALKLAQELALLALDGLSPAMQLQTTSPEARWILDYARTQHLAQRFQPTQDGAGSWPLKRYELGLRPGLAYRTEIFRRVLLRPRVWERFDLPDALFPLYALLSPIEWLLFHRWLSPAGVARRRRSLWHRWRTLPASRRWLLAEAFATLLAARSSLVLLPVRWIFRWLESPPRHPAVPDGSEIVEEHPLGGAHCRPLWPALVRMLSAGARGPRHAAPPRHSQHYALRRAALRRSPDARTYLA